MFGVLRDPTKYLTSVKQAGFYTVSNSIMYGKVPIVISLTVDKVVEISEST